MPQKRQSYNQFILVFAMNEAESLFLERVNHEREVSDLKAQLQGKTELLYALQARIAQLQGEPQNSFWARPSKTVLDDQETQCSFQSELSQASSEKVAGLQKDLCIREKEAIDQHLVTKQLELEVEDLRKRLMQRGESDAPIKLNQVGQQGNQQEGYLGQEKLDSNEMVPEEESAKAIEIKDAGQESLKEELRILEEENMILRQEGAKMRQEIRRQEEEVRQVRKALNEKEWRLFCFKTELELSFRQCDHLKQRSEAMSTRLQQLEAALKHKQTALFTEEEENSFLRRQNQSIASELRRQQQKLNQLTPQLAEFQQAKERENIMHEEILRLADRLKETSYRLKEKEEEKDEIGSCLRRRIEELDDLKMKVIALEKQKGEGDEANERLRGQNYQLEQGSSEQEEIMKRQSEKIDQLEGQLQEINKRSQDAALLGMLQKAEHANLLAAMEAEAAEQTRKINRLTVQMVEREIISNKNAQRVTQAQKALQQSNAKYLDIFQQFERISLESRMNLEKINKYEGEMLESRRERATLEATLRLKETKAISLNGQLERSKVENIALRLMVSQRQEEIASLRTAADVLQDAIGSVKLRLEQQIERHCIFREEYRQESLLLKRNLEMSQRQQEKQLLAFAREKDRLLGMASLLIKKIQSILQSTDPKAEETTQFQILGGEEERVGDFELLQKIGSIIEGFRGEVEQIAQLQA